MADEAVTQAAEQAIHQTVDAAAAHSYMGLFGTINWIVCTSDSTLLFECEVFYSFFMMVATQPTQHMADNLVKSNKLVTCFIRLLFFSVLQVDSTAPWLMLALIIVFALGCMYYRAVLCFHQTYETKRIGNCRKCQ